MSPTVDDPTVTAPTAAAHFELESCWHVDAPVETVWAALTQPDRWPQWWPYVRAVHAVREGRDDGVGRVRRIDWRTRLPYGITIEVETVEVVRHQRLRALSRGQLRGEGLWQLRPVAGGTEVVYLWRVQVARPWMRRLAPLLSPVFRWNHDGVMAAGEAGLRRHLRHTGTARD